MIRHAIETKLDISLKERRQWLRDVVKELIAEHFAADSDETHDEVEDTLDLTESTPAASGSTLSTDTPTDGAVGAALTAGVSKCAEGVGTRPPGTMGLMMPARLPKGPTMLVQLASSDMSFSGGASILFRACTLCSQSLRVKRHLHSHPLLQTRAPSVASRWWTVA